MIVDCLSEAMSNDRSYVDRPTYFIVVSTLGSGLMLKCFHVEGQARDDRDKVDTLAITDAKVVQLSFNTQYGMSSGPKADTVVGVSHNL